ncbi:hypothetical protein K2173_003200 [Erythroxylum novogranatense]|uniref:DUF220 domain-containing protein n=1 Tax=Erythroxylum novogranatense TaxID=1862640 RepID=A0AAV8SWX3_9ROSI|nr:hypothetical protein K2173_003200 [Erythroxylum novogranatense]
MGDAEGKAGNIGVLKSKRTDSRKAFDPAVFVQLQHKLQNSIKSQLKKLVKYDDVNPLRKENGSSAALGINLEKQLQAWKENSSWSDQPPKIKVSVPKGSLCNLSVDFDVGLPPDAVYNIVTDPDNRRVFKNIKEVISRKVLLDDGQRQVVEVEQAALWKFLWWSGTISVHVLVDQNRRDHSMKFKQLKTGFMKRFEGSWKVEPVFVDEKVCYPFKPKTWEEYSSCTGARGRVGSKVSLEQLIQPAIVPPPPISWYLRGITSKTTEMIANDLLAEAARIRGDLKTVTSAESESDGELEVCNSVDIKARWALHRRTARKHHRRLLTS